MARVDAWRARAPCAALWFAVRLGNLHPGSFGCCRRVHGCTSSNHWSQKSCQRRLECAEAKTVHRGASISSINAASAAVPCCSKLKYAWAVSHPSHIKGPLSSSFDLRARLFERRFSAAAVAPFAAGGNAASAAAVARHTAALAASPAASAATETGVGFEQGTDPPSRAASSGDQGHAKEFLLAALLVAASGAAGMAYVGDTPWRKEGLTSVSEWMQQLGRNVDAAMSDMHERMQNAVDDALAHVFPDDSEPLLPDFADLNYPNFLPTLVVDFDGVLAKIEHDRTGGYKIRKRPYSDFFINQLSHFYEVVVWTDEQPPGVQTALQQWGLPVTACLSADSMTRFEGKRVKDLSRLGRRLDRVLYMSPSDSSIDSRFQDNFIRIKPFSGSDDSSGDEELLHLLDFLKHCSLYPDDVRLRLRRWGGGADGDVGRRYNSAKQQEQHKAQQRRSIGRFLGMQQSQSSQPLQQLQPSQRSSFH